MTFAQWMHRADAAVQARAGLSIHDLPDVAFRDLYDSGAEPEDAAIEALEAADYPADLLDEE